MAVVLLVALFFVDHYRWELLQLTHRNAAQNAVFNWAVTPLLACATLVVSAFVVGGVLGNWNKITSKRNKLIPLSLAGSILAFYFILILGA